MLQVPSSLAASQVNPVTLTFFLTCDLFYFLINAVLTLPSVQRPVVVASVVTSYEKSLLGSDCQFRLLIFFITQRMRIVDLNERLNLSSSNVTLGTEAQEKKACSVNDQGKMTFFSLQSHLQHSQKLVHQLKLTFSY